MGDTLYGEPAMAERSHEQVWNPLGSGVDPRSETPGIDEAALVEPLAWDQPSLVTVAPGADLFAAPVSRADIERIVSIVAATAQHSYLVLTTSVKRLLALGNDGLSFPRNLWIGVPVESDEHVWRAEDLLRCNTSRAWVAVDPIAGPLPSLPVSMLAWVVCRIPATGEADPFGLGWVRDLRDRCVAAGVPFRFEERSGDGSRSSRELDGRTWDQQPTDLLPSSDR